MAEPGLCLTQKAPPWGWRNKPEKRAVKSSCDDAPCIRAEEGEPRGQGHSAREGGMSGTGGQRRLEIAGYSVRGGMPGLPASRALRRLPCPVCARHTVQTAGLVRRRLRLTPEVNPACLCPSARPTFSFFRVPQLPVCARYAVRPAEFVRRALRLTAGVNPACLCSSARPPEGRSRAPER